jgi:hypothetical protein
MTKPARDITTDAQIDAALKRAKLLENEPLAKTVEYVASHKLLVVGLTNGRRLMIPIEDVQGLSKGTTKQLRKHELIGRGTGIYFPDLDAPVYVPALIEGIYGTRSWMAGLGSKGGSAKSAAKQRAARANGAKGGRPRKKVAA